MRRRTTVYDDDNIVPDSEYRYESYSFFNPVSTVLGIVLVGLLVWALIWGPIGEMFDGDGQGPRLDPPVVNRG
jgi:hypothetical protein